MARLPTPGGDSGNWGSILNDYLSQVHASDGTLKTDSVTSDAIAPNAIDAVSIADGSITETLLDTAVQTKLNATAPVTSVASKTGDVTLTKSDVGLDQVDNTSDATKNSATATLTNKTISGSNNTITNLPASSLPDASRLVVTTTYGLTGTEDGANTWAKIATFSTGNVVYRDVQVVLQIVAGYGAYGASATILAFLRSNSGNNPTVGVKILSCTDSTAPQYNFASDAFKIISGGWTSDAELWMRKPTNYGQYAVYELSRFCGNGASVPVYNDGAAWQSAVPTGTVNNVSSDGVVSATGKLSVYATTGDTPTIAAIGNDTNKNLNITTKGTGTVKINNVDAVTISDTQTLTNKTLTTPIINSINDTNDNTILSLSPTASAVNYLQISNRDTSKYPIIQALGANTDIGVTVIPKGSGAFRLYGETGQTVMTLSATSSVADTNLDLTTQGSGVVKANGVQVADISSVQTLTSKILTNPKIGGAIYDTTQSKPVLAFSAYGGAVNYLAMTGTTTGVAPFIKSVGTDTNVDLNLTTQGTGVVQANGVDVATISDTQTLTNKTIDGSSNTLTNLPAKATVEVFTCQGGNYVINKQLTSNVATLTTLTDHGYQIGDKVWINGIDATFNSSYAGPTTITGVPTSTTFTYAKTAGDVVSTPVAPYGNVFQAQYWTKPAGAVLVKFTLCGSGGGGGSGARQATTSNRTGGGGGGGGGYAEVTYPASEVQGTAITVLVPNGGYGGLPVTTDDTTGMSGQKGGGAYATTVRASDYGDSGELSLYAVSGYGGTGGTTGATAAGGLGGGNTQYSGGYGGNGTTTNGSIGANATYVGSGGGGGGGAAASSTAAAAGATGAIIFAIRALNAIHVSPGNGVSTMDATTNTAYYTVKAGQPGMGGGGGAYKTATNGGNASDATNYCAGGGGGGASDNGYQSGAGGKGADGCVVITTYF